MLLMLFCLFVYSFPPFSLFFDNIAIFIMGKNRPDCMKCDKNTGRRKGMICPTCLPKANKAELKLHESKKAEVSRQECLARLELLLTSVPIPCFVWQESAKAVSTLSDVCIQAC